MVTTRDVGAGGFENGIVHEVEQDRKRFPRRHAPSIAIGERAESSNQVGWATVREDRLSGPMRIRWTNLIARSV